MMENDERIMKLLCEKSATKQQVFRVTTEFFAMLKKVAKETAERLEGQMCTIDDNVKLSFKDNGPYEGELHFSGDILLLNMHTNVFTFDKGHSMWKTDYIRKDKRRAYFGLINVYNFLADSFKYNRLSDKGVLLGRLFVNCEGHFFVEGKRQLGFLHQNLSKDRLNEDALRDIIGAAMVYALEYDLTTPDFQNVMLVSVEQMQSISNQFNLMTSKELGFRFHTRMTSDE